MEVVEVARRGQITIPKSVRDHLGIQQGQTYSLRAVEGGILVLTPRAGKAAAALAQLREELLDRGATLEDMIAELRRMRESGEP